MPSSLRDPKTLSEWLELDYFRRPRLLRRLWYTVLVLAFVGSAVVFAWFFFMPRQRGGFQSRPVSTAHAMFNNNCGVCHTEAFRTWDRLARFDSSLRSVPNSACESCHSGPKHHETQIGERDCAECHKEHRGHATLMRLDDNHCTSCHADLKRNDGTTPGYDVHVTAFAPGRHPEFRLWRDGESDPGKITFNHAVHLRPQGIPTLDPGQRARQRAEAAKLGAAIPGDDRPVVLERLDCQSCHQPDEAGRYMRPIRFDSHCQKCHALSMQLIGGWQDKGLEALAQPLADSPVPHPSPSQGVESVRGVARDRLSRFITDPKHQAFLGQPAEPESERAVPGTPPAARLSAKQFEWVNEQQRKIERLLFDGSCKRCHQETSDPARGPSGLPSFVASNIPERWQKHAMFNHQSHRMLGCVQCHAATTSERAADVLMPKVEMCWKCHNTQAPKARADCAECHLYHDPKERLKFRGSRPIE
jgi:predicted CXXCH cytochrome family protein